MESAGSYTSSASADSSPSNSAADSSATTTDAGAVTPESQSTAVESGTVETEAATSQEDTAASAEGTKDHKKTLEERAEEIADRKIQQRMAEAEARRQGMQAAQPDFVPIDYNRYDSHIARLIGTERQLQDELALDPENPVVLVRELRRVQAERSKLENDFAVNEQKRQAWTQRNQFTMQQQAVTQQKQAEIYQAIGSLPQTLGESPEMVEAGRVFMMNAMSRDPALQSKFDGIVNHKTMYHGFSGPAAAVEWAFSHAKANMGQAAEAARQQREAGKDKTIGAGGQGSALGGVSTYSEWLNLPTKQMNQFVKDHPQKFEALKTKHFK